MLLFYIFKKILKQFILLIPNNYQYNIDNIILPYFLPNKALQMPPKKKMFNFNFPSLNLKQYLNVNKFFLISSNFFLVEHILTLFRVVCGKKVTPAIFPPVTSTDVGISLQNLLTFSFSHFSTLV